MPGAGRRDASRSCRSSVESIEIESMRIDGGTEPAFESSWPSCGYRVPLASSAARSQRGNCTKSQTPIRCYEGRNPELGALSLSMCILAVNTI
mmetsp:Transcript_683/g.1644  ORF Transcript_683/g.1644 Transcript_683/m.1644 type:complete len:93 (-) Transcript_683:1085-1363(-)